MADDSAVMMFSLASQRAVMSLCRVPVHDSDQAISFVSSVEHASGFYSSTIPRPGSDPEAAIAQARRVHHEAGRTHFVWAPADSPLTTACWQQQFIPTYALAVMATTQRFPVPDHPVTVELLHVTDHDTADLFRQVHCSRFSAVDNPAAVVEHFAGDHVLLDPSIHAMVVLDNGQPAAAGYLHVADQLSGLYWIATSDAFRHCGHGSRVTAALLAAAPSDVPVVLQATRLGRPVYRRQGFQDHGLVWCWAIND